MDEVKKKLRIIKKERKHDEAEAEKKDKQMKIRGKGKGKEEEKKVEEKQPEDDIFGGAVLVTSKDKEEELKAKPAQKI
jgi:hypothetical protein